VDFVGGKESVHCIDQVLLADPFFLYLRQLGNQGGAKFGTVFSDDGIAPLLNDPSETSNENLS
jgi:hypothetical protein